MFGKSRIGLASRKHWHCDTNGCILIVYGQSEVQDVTCRLEPAIEAAVVREPQDSIDPAPRKVARSQAAALPPKLLTSRPTCREGR